MKRAMVISALSGVMLLLLATPSYAWRGRVFVAPGWGPWWPPVYEAPPVVVEQPPVVVQQPQLYVQKAPPSSSYYCASTQAFYPAVQTCSQPWINVPPPPQ